MEREKALKEAKANAESNGAQDKASMSVVKELLREEGKRCALACIGHVLLGDLCQIAST